MTTPNQPLSGEETISMNRKPVDIDSTTIVKPAEGEGLQYEIPAQGQTQSGRHKFEGIEIGDYIAKYCLGVGGMGEVWLAERKKDQEKVAIKILREEYLNMNPDFYDRFMNEIEHTGRLKHEHIIKSYGGGQENGVTYMVAEFIDGQSIDDYREEQGGTLAENEALEIIRAVADGLRYAWNNFSLIHRDLKPANIMRTKEGQPKLMDMGLSKCIEDTSKKLTMTGEILGSPSYMSPEQASAKKNIDFKIDIYGLGTTLYRLVTGEIPFVMKKEDTSIVDMLKRVIKEPLPMACDKNPKISRECSELIAKMTEKSPDDRQASWEEVIRDIDVILKGGAIWKQTGTQRTMAQASIPQKEKKNNTFILILIFGVTIFIVLILAVVYFVLNM